MPFIMILAQLTALRKMIHSFIVASLAYSWRSILSITQMNHHDKLSDSIYYHHVALSLCLLARPSPCHLVIIR